MTRATIHVQIPRPCHEAWEAMTPTAQGRYCAACQHPVTDFSQRTDAEVLALLRQAAGQRVCGQFRAEQLNRALVQAPVAAPRWRAWVLAAATLWGLLPTAARSQELRATHSGGPVPAGGNRPAIQQLPSVNSDPGGTSADTIKVTKGELVAVPVGLIRGRVIDQASGEGIPGATVLVQGTTIGVGTKADGNFELNVPTSSVALRISSVGYVTREVTAVDPMQPLALALDSHVLGGAEVVVSYSSWYSPRGLWYRLRSLPRRLTGRW